MKQPGQDMERISVDREDVVPIPQSGFIDVDLDNGLFEWRKVVAGPHSQDQVSLVQKRAQGLVAHLSHTQAEWVVFGDGPFALMRGYHRNLKIISQFCHSGGRICPHNPTTCPNHGAAGGQ